MSATAAQCAECGFDFEADRVRLATACHQFPALVEEVLEEPVADDQVRHRPTAQTWSAIEYAAHLSEALSWYARRIECVLAEDVPQLEPFDFDAAAVAGGYRRRSTHAVIGDISSACHHLASLVRSITDTEMNRSGLGSDGSPRSVATLMARAHHELVHHERDLRLVLRSATSTS